MRQGGGETMTVAEKKSYLQWIRRVRYDQDAILEELATLRTRMMSASAKIGDGMPRGGGGSGDLSGYAAKVDELETRLEARLSTYLDAMARLEEDIQAMSDPKEQAVLREYYINGRQWADVARIMGFTIRHVTRLHGWALQHINLQVVLVCPS
ncbi:MAG: hypothetical protein J6S50_05765 [Oscillospiraceae bacterium]|nr:hypothetical protein [Oscillospiraceae bacterium]